MGAQLTELKYPALFTAADKASISHQSWYIRLIILEYCLLFTTAVLSMGFSQSPIYYAFFAFLIISAVAALIFRSAIKPEQNWYVTRALAESVKTLTWRYAMRAKPFDSLDEEADKIDFTNNLQALLSDNKRAASAIAGTDAQGDQFTSEMKVIRNLPLNERLAFYLKERVGEQKTWYNNKAKQNKKASEKWVFTGILTYFFAFVCVMARIVKPELAFLPIEPLLVFSSTVIGWMQIKKYNELASAYTLTF